MRSIRSMTLFTTVLLSLGYLGSVRGENGELVYRTKACDTCHSAPASSIEAKMPKLGGPDLIDLDNRFDRDKLIGYIRQEIQVDGKKHPRQLKCTDEELRLLIDFLFEQRTAGRPPYEPPREE